MIRAYRYRIYPTAIQIATLDRWESACRWAWNHWVDQRRQLLRADCYAGKYDHGYEIPALRRVHPWLSEPPCQALHSISARMHKAWQACFARQAKPPRFKARGRDSVSIEVQVRPDEQIIQRDEQGRPHLHFPKLEPVRIVYDRPLGGVAKTATITRSSTGAWHVVVTCEVAEIEPRSGPIVGIDRGIADTLHDSEGRAVKAPRYLSAELRRLRVLQRRVSRRAVRGKPDSHRCRQARAAVAKLHAHLAEQRRNWLHHESRYYADTASHVVLEDLRVSNMVRGRLSRSILEQGWATFATQLESKMAPGRVSKVPAHHTSQTCAACGVVDARSRVGKSYRCVHCGHTADADANAAAEIRRRGIEILAAQAADPSPSASGSGRSMRRNARSTGASRQKPNGMRAEVVTPPVVVGLMAAKSAEHADILGGNSETLVDIGSTLTTRSQTEVQPRDITDAIPDPRVERADLMITNGEYDAEGWRDSSGQVERADLMITNGELDKRDEEDLVNEWVERADLMITNGEGR